LSVVFNGSLFEAKEHSDPLWQVML